MKTISNEENEKKQLCLICFSDEIMELKCKLICQNCGYKRDCSDP